jgi:hypothetical protein
MDVVGVKAAYSPVVCVCVCVCVRTAQSRETQTPDLSNYSKYEINPE